MKRAVLLFGLSFAVLAGCSDSSKSTDNVPDGDVDPRRSVVDADRLEGVVADGVDTVKITITARDSTGAVTKNRAVEVTSSVASDVIILDAPATDANGEAIARLTATTAGRRVVTVKVDGIRLNATGQALTIDFDPGMGSALAFVVSPGPSQVGVPLQPAVKVEILDANGNRTSGTDEVTLGVDKSDESETVAAVDGVATFSSFRLKSPGDKRLVATASGLASATSNLFSVTPGAPARLTFEEQPLSVVAAGQPIPLKVAVRDSAGNVVNQGPGASAVVMVRLFSNPTRAQLEGTLTATAAEGIASFDDVRIQKNASGYSLVAFTPDASFQSAESTPFEVRSSVPAISSSSFSLAPSVGVADGRSPVKIAIRLADAYGNAVANQAVQLSATGSGNSFSPSANLFTNSVGRIEAEFTSDVAEDKIVTANVLGQFSMEGLVHFAAGDIDAEKSTLTASDDTATADGTASITFEVVVRDSAGNPIVGQRAVASATGSSNVWLAPGASGDTDENGLVSFTLTSTKAEAKAVTVSVAGILFTTDVTYEAGAAVQGRSTKVTGDSQASREVAKQLLTPLKVRILDINSNPVVGKTVKFERIFGDGSFVLGDPLASVKEVVTQADGTAETTFVLGTKAGTGTDRVAVTHESVALEYVFNATAGSPDSIAVWPDDDASVPLTTEATVFTSLAGNARVGVIVKDRFRNPVPGLAIAFSITSEPGPSGPTTGADLSATATTASSGTNPPPGVALPLKQRLNQKPGPNVFTAVCSNATLCGTIANQPVPITINGTVGPAAKVVVSGGSGQTGTVDTPLANPLEAKVTDQYDNPVGGQAVTFEALDGGQVLTGATGNSDALTGLVVATYKLGNAAGTNKNVAKATCGACTITQSKVVNFTATAAPGDPATLEMPATNHGNTQNGPVATALAQPFRVTLKDSFGNPISGKPVTFEVTGGGGKFGTNTSTSVNSNAAGEATATLTLGDLVGANTATATHGSLPPVTFNATGNPGPVASLTVVGTPPTSGTVGQALANDFVVEAKDAKGNLVVSRNNAVTFSVTGGNGASISPAGGVATDASGHAATRLTLGTVAGTDLYTVTATGGTATPVQFKASAAASTATKFSMVSGNSQSGPINNPLAAPIVVEAKDASDNPVSGVVVDFTVTTGGGTADPASVVTGADGKASTTWTLGSAPGFAHVLRATAGALPALIFNAEGIDVGALAKAPAPNGDNQSGEVTTELPLELKVLVTAAGGAPMPNQTVSFTAADGSFSPANAVTDASGIASTSYTLGTLAGAKTVTATLGSRSVVFNLTATAGAAANLELDWDGATTGTVRQTLPTPVVATVTDDYDNPVSGVTVTFSTADEDAEVGTDSIATNAAGKAQSTWTLGSVAGPQSLTVTANGITKTAGATATAGAATKLVLDWDGATTGTVRQTLPTAVVATVTDDDDNPILGVIVTFATTDEDALVGTGSIATNAAGKAQSTWTLGSVAGPQSLTVTANGITQTAGATAIAGEATKLELTWDGAATGTVRQTLPTPVVVTVTDDDDNPVSGVTVTFSTADEDAEVGTDSIATNAAGKAQSTWTLGSVAGPQSLTVTANGITKTAGATATAGAAAKLVLAWDDDTTGTVLQMLPTPVVATVTDDDDNPVSGVTVTFATTDEDALVGTGSIATDAAGKAQSTWTLGWKAGPQSLTVTAGTLIETALATATADVADSMTVAAGHGQVASPGNEYGAAVAVMVWDAHGNPVPLATVNFAVTGGDLVATLGDASASTDANGLAWTTVTPAAAGVIDVEAALQDDPAERVAFTLESTSYPVGRCTGYGPAFQTFLVEMRVADAGVYDVDSGTDYVLQVRIEDAIDGVPAVGQVATGLLLVCEDPMGAGTSEYVQIDALGARLDGGAADMIDITTTTISATHGAGGWTVECGAGGIAVFVADPVDGILPRFEVYTSDGPEGICYWDTVDPPPVAVVGPTLFVP